MRGYTGADSYFHTDVDCHVMYGDVVSLPETKALKWGKDYCPHCF